MKKILILDDDPSLLALVRVFLSGEYEVAAFSQGEAALEAAVKINPDIIFTDVLMPGMTGYEFMVNLKRADSPIKHIPIIVMSTRESMEMIFDEQAIVSFLPKPFTKDDLKNAVADALNAK